MALTTKGKKWETKHFLFAIMGFFPILNGVAFIHMSSRIKNKKWSLIGWIAIILNIAFILGTVILGSVDNPNNRPTYTDVVPMPQAIDYMNSEQKSLYYNDSSYLNSADFKLTKEYLAYKDAERKWFDDEKIWKNQSEIIEETSKYERFNSTISGLVAGMNVALIVLNLLLIIILFNNRPKYLKLLEKEENKSVLSKRLQTVNADVKSDISKENKQAKINIISTMDINSASEEEISKLQGLTIIDAKKAIAYRKEHNGFDNLDEFFDCIDVKPHIIINLQEILTVGIFKEAKIKKECSGKRQLDL